MLSVKVWKFCFAGVRITLKNPSQSQTLLEYLRSYLGLTGTKLSCGESSCGSCTVTCTYLERTNDVGDNGLNIASSKCTKVRHRAINACSTKLISLHGVSITTIEGLGSVNKARNIK